jgi:hypothetical protein
MKDAKVSWIIPPIPLQYSCSFPVEHALPRGGFGL